MKANFVAACTGAFMYFATLTEVPILQSLLAGIHKRPALALLLAGHSVSLPNVLFISSVWEIKNTHLYPFSYFFAIIACFLHGCC